MSNGQGSSQKNTPNNKPVAYDAEGRPLYSAPQVSSQQIVPQVVHVARASEPVPVEISPETKRRHEESAKKYPWINLSEQEYVISAVRRHSVGMWGTVAAMLILTTIILVAILNFPYISEVMNLPKSATSTAVIIGLLMIVLLSIGSYIAIWVYQNNWFILTNESVIQEIQMSLFSHRQQTVSLMNIEDASYTQSGLLQTWLNYGSIRLSTEGDETTYRFEYVANPRHEVAILNDAVEAFKNGRPVETLENDRH